MHEIVLSDNVKPALEWVNGRVLQKAFAGTKHAIAQARFAGALGEWADKRGSGFAGLEWRFQVQPPGEIRRSLTPDIAYLSYDRYPLEEFESDAAPTVAPDVVVEIRSPEDLQSDIDEKIRVYLAAGTTAIFLVDPYEKSAKVIDSHGEHDLSTGPIAHSALPGFTLDPMYLFRL